MKTFETQDIPDLRGLPPFERELVYCGLDTMVTREAFDKQNLLLDDTSRATYHTSRAFLGPALYMMRRGFLIDPVLREQVVSEQQKERERLNNLLQELAEVVWGQGLNYNSPKQMLEFFYGDWLFIPTQYENKKGEMKPSTGRPVLERIRNEYARAEPFCNIILALRDVDKIIGTLTQDLLEGRWHATFNPVGTDTWRWSSSSHPLNVGANLQNIDDEVRRAFIPDPDFYLFSFDQQGAEAKAVAYITGDEEYIKAVESGDVHTFVASMVFGIPNTKEAAEQIYYREDTYRQISKKFSHGCLDGLHEVLTRTGWQNIAAVVDSDEEIMVWKDGKTWFEKPSHWTSISTRNTVRMEGQSISMHTSLGHRLVYTTNDKLRVGTANYVRSLKQAKIPKCGIYQEGTTDLPLAAKLACFHADGSVERVHGARFKFRKIRKINQFRALFPHLSPKYNHKNVLFSIPAKEAKEFTKYGKQLDSYVFNWSAEMCKHYIDSYLKWDGYSGPTGHRRLMTSNRKQAEWLQIVAHLAGYSAHWGREQHGTGFNPNGTIYNIQLNSRKYAHTASLTCSKVDQHSVEIPMYCPTVSSGFFITRRNNHIHVTGNSNYNGTAYTLARQARAPRNLVENFQNAYFKRFPGIKAWHRWTALQLERKGYLITAYGDRRQFWNRLWDDSTIRSAIAFQPQHIVGKLTAVACHRIWSELPHEDVQLLANGHDAVILQIRKNKVAEYYPRVLECLKNPLSVLDINGKTRELYIPWDAEVGYNWGKRKEKKDGTIVNPQGMRRYKGPLTLQELDAKA